MKGRYLITFIMCFGLCTAALICAYAQGAPTLQGGTPLNIEKQLSAIEKIQAELPATDPLWTNLYLPMIMSITAHAREALAIHGSGGPVSLPAQLTVEAGLSTVVTSLTIVDPDCMLAMEKLEDALKKFGPDKGRAVRLVRSARYAAARGKMYMGPGARYLQQSIIEIIVSSGNGGNGGNPGILPGPPYPIIIPTPVPVIGPSIYETYALLLESLYTNAENNLKRANTIFDQLGYRDPRNGNMIDNFEYVLEQLRYAQVDIALFKATSELAYGGYGYGGYGLIDCISPLTFALSALERIDEAIGGIQILAYDIRGGFSYPEGVIKQSPVVALEPS